jgi:BNR repeat-containing family member
MKHWWFATLAIAASLSVARAGNSSPNDAPGVTSIHLRCVDAKATGYGTFQSHNQKVISNRRGIFMTHLRSRNEAYTAQSWRLSWSTNAGESFATLFAATNATNPPLLESDADDNLYLVRPDFGDGHAYLYRFRADENYREPHITRIPNGSAGKFAMVLDARRQQLAYFAHNNTFHLVGLDGVMRSSTNLLTAGPNAALQYPLLSLGEDDTLHVAWTTQKNGNVYLYWDIHYLQSPDGGLNWRHMDGRSVPLPVVADETGPADRITLDDEFACHTWLSNFMVKDGKAHFLYLAQTNPPRQHYVRYDLRTARREVDLQPEFRGERISLRGLDGFFAAPRHQKNSRLYCISRDATQPRLACLVSEDNGATWHDYAVSEPVISPYAIGGCREVTADGWVIGSFTDSGVDPKDPERPPRVYFFKIQAGLPLRRPAKTNSTTNPPASLP